MTTLVICNTFLEGLLRIFGLVYVFRLFDVGCDSRSVMFSDLRLHDSCHGMWRRRSRHIMLDECSWMNVVSSNIIHPLGLDVCAYSGTHILDLTSLSSQAL